MMSGVVKFSRQAMRIMAGYSMYLLVLLVSPALAQQSDCATGSRLQHTFNSGASWSLCATINPDDGLALTDVYYRAPGDTSRSTFAELHVSQILLQYHDSRQAEPQIVPAAPDQSIGSLQEQNTAHFTQNCAGEWLPLDESDDGVCTHLSNDGILAKYSQRASLHGQTWELSRAFINQTLTWNIAWRLTEDGQVQPRINLSGRANRQNSNGDFAEQNALGLAPLTRASLLAIWRIVPDMDSPSPDTIEQFEFVLDPTNNNRRHMQITPISSESLLQVNRERFRGWRIKDESGSGYYLDPSNNGYRFTSPEHQWANFDVAITQHKECERHASNNLIEQTTTPCGANLDDFINSETLQQAQPVLWYSQTNDLTPSIEDWPVIRDIQVGFDLQPFDWTDASPFEATE